MRLVVPSRYLPFALCLATFSASLFGIDASPGWRWLAALSGALGLVGVLDL